jgi:tetratricopeptide (TPR) repeat protein
LQAGLKLQPDTPGALFDLGNSFYKLKRFDQAIAQYEKAFALEKNLWPAINNIGLVKYEMGDVDGAIKRWEQAIAIDDKAAESMLALAVALYGKGDQAKGLAMGEAALKLDKRYATVEYLKENLWGDRLIAATQNFLATPQIKAALATIQDAPPSPEMSP